MVKEHSRVRRGSKLHIIALIMFFVNEALHSKFMFGLFQTKYSENAMWRAERVHASATALSWG